MEFHQPSSPLKKMHDLQKSRYHFSSQNVITTATIMLFSSLSSHETNPIEKELDVEEDENEKWDEQEESDEMKQQQDDGVEWAELDDKSQQIQEDDYPEYPECTSLSFREEITEISMDGSDFPRPLSQETRNLTASELLLNKSVNTRIANQKQTMLFRVVHVFTSVHPFPQNI